MISNILQPLPITKLNANMPPSPSPTKKPHTAFTPTTASLLTSLNLEPPATPEQPDILTGRGYSNDELDLVAALESPAAKSSTNESSTPLISNDELDLVAALESPAAKSKSNYLVAVFESPAAKSNTTLTSTPINTFTSLERYLFHPNTLEYLLPTTFGVLPLVAKAFSAHASTSEPYWYTGCHALARVHDLYLPYPTEEKIHGSFKRIFFEQLFPARHKWAQAPVQASTDDGTAPVLPPSTDFKIQVASRFRPGERKKSAILLPLHQRLRLLRKQRGQATIGKSLPAEFIDPLMGGVMSDPVKLPSSGKVSERKIILAHLKSARTDPFDGTPLTPAQLLPCEELTTQLEEWRAAKQQAFHDDTSGTDDFRVAADDTKALTEMGGDITPEILQALLEADRLETDLKLAEEQASVREARKNRPKRFNKWGEEEEEETANENAPPPSETPAQPNPSVHAEADVKLSAVAKAQTETESLANIVNGPQKKDARVLAIEKSRVLMHIDGRGIRPFLMSGGCFAPNSTQTDVYAQCGRAPVVSALNGLNACLIAYGQTGSGKTHTMFGPEGVLLECWLNAVETAKREGVSVQDVARSVRKGDVGLAVRACAEICECLGLNDRAEGEGDVISTLSVQYVQIYNEQITCLLGSTNEVHMRGEMMQGARCESVTSLPRMLELLVLAEQNKKRAATAMNERSSRSHSVLVFNIAQRNTVKDSLVSSCLHIVDLAGSERLKKSKVEGVHKAEAININTSLMVLGKCVSALVEKKSHVPYFESKLTAILRNSLGGNSRTTAIVACRMDDDHANETLQSLRFGERCAAITNTVAAAATNATDAIRAIDRSLELCVTQLASLEKRNMTKLPMYNQVKEKYNNLQLKRGEIGGK